MAIKLQAVCDSDDCCPPMPYIKSRKGPNGKTYLKTEYIKLKDVAIKCVHKDAVFCPDCGHALFWKREE